MSKESMMTVKTVELKELASELYQLVHIKGIFSTKDLILYDKVLKELRIRGIEPDVTEHLTFRSVK